MMAGSDGDVFHSSGFCQSDPGVRVELLGIEKLREAIVFVEGQLSVMEHPLTIAEHAINPPMNEHAEFCILKFLTSFQVPGGGLVVVLRRSRTLRSRGLNRRCPEMQD